MTDWIYFPDPKTDAAYSEDGSPIDAGTMEDHIWFALKVLMENSPASSGYPIGNGDRTTAQTVYSNTLSCLAKFPIEQIRPSPKVPRPRHLVMEFWVKISGGATGIIRGSASPRDEIPGTIPKDDVAWDESGTFVDAAGAWVTLTIPIEQINTMGAIDGAGEGDRISYRTIYVVIQGRVTVGAGTITWMSGYDLEATP